jgi:hypothetical protein
MSADTGGQSIQVSPEEAEGRLPATWLHTEEVTGSIPVSPTKGGLHV